MYMLAFNPCIIPKGSKPYILAIISHIKNVNNRTIPIVRLDCIFLSKA